MVELPVQVSRLSENKIFFYLILLENSFILHQNSEGFEFLIAREYRTMLNAESTVRVKSDGTTVYCSNLYPFQNDSSKDESLLCGNTTVRLVIRDMCGKHCLDVSTLYGPKIHSEVSFPGE